MKIFELYNNWCILYIQGIPDHRPGKYINDRNFFHLEMLEKFIDINLDFHSLLFLVILRNKRSWIFLKYVWQVCINDKYVFFSVTHYFFIVRILPIWWKIASYLDFNSLLVSAVNLRGGPWDQNVSWTIYLNFSVLYW